LFWDTACGAPCLSRCENGLAKMVSAAEVEGKETRQIIIYYIILFSERLPGLVVSAPKLPVSFIRYTYKYARHSSLGVLGATLGGFVNQITLMENAVCVYLSALNTGTYVGVRKYLYIAIRVDGERGSDQAPLESASRWGSEGRPTGRGMCIYYNSDV